jgi:hypothetical protein
MLEDMGSGSSQAIPSSAFGSPHSILSNKASDGRVIRRPGCAFEAMIVVK